MTPVVSVIVPNYNHAPFLPKRLDSILNQTVANIEVIVLDDCSTDKSRKVIEEYAANHARISTHFNEKNSGSPFRQWKKGIDAARGKYIWIAESDDFADHELLEKLLKAMQKHPEAGLAYCQSHFVDADGTLSGSHLENLNALHPYLWQNDFCMDGKEVLARFMPVINIIPNAGAAVFKKELCEYVPWDKLFAFKLAGDRFFWCNLLFHADLCFVAQAMNYFRTDGDTVRSRHLYSVLYLNEVRIMVEWICARVKVPHRVKNQALRQWMHYFRNAKNNNPEKSLGFYAKSLQCVMHLLFLYLKPSSLRPAENFIHHQRLS